MKRKNLKETKKRRDSGLAVSENWEKGFRRSPEKREEGEAILRSVDRMKGGKRSRYRPPQEKNSSGRHLPENPKQQEKVGVFDTPKWDKNETGRNRGKCTASLRQKQGRTKNVLDPNGRTKRRRMKSIRRRRGQAVGSKEMGETKKGTSSST